MAKKVLLFIGLVGAGLIATLSDPWALEQPLPSSPDTQHANPLLEINEEAFVEAYERLIKADHHARNNQHPTSQENALTVQLRETVSPPFPPKKGVKPMESVAFDPEQLAQLQIGDTIHLPIIEGTEHTLNITQKTLHANGSVTLRASIANEEESYTSTLTQGKQLSYATIATPNGLFQLEAIEGEGYLYSMNAIDNAWINYQQSDMLFPKASHSPKTPHHPNE